MSFGPWQSAFRNVSRATRRLRVGGITTKNPRRKPAPEGSPRARGRRFRHEDDDEFASGVAACLIAITMTLLFYMVPLSFAPIVGVIVVVATSIPIVLSRFSFRRKFLWILLLCIPPLIVILGGRWTTGWTIFK